MFPIIDTRMIITSMGKKYLNVCLGKDNKEIAYYGYGYFYLNKSGNKLTDRIYKM